MRGLGVRVLPRSGLVVENSARGPAQKSNAGAGRSPAVAPSTYQCPSRSLSESSGPFSGAADQLTASGKVPTLISFVRSAIQPQTVDIKSDYVRASARVCCDSWYTYNDKYVLFCQRAAVVICMHRASGAAHVLGLPETESALGELADFSSSTVDTIG